MARFPQHHALKYRMSLAIPLPTDIAVAVDASLDMAEVQIKRNGGFRLAAL